jgi:hypothetical protein
VVLAEIDLEILNYVLLNCEMGRVHVIVVIEGWMLKRFVPPLEIVKMKIDNPIICLLRHNTISTIGKLS